MRLIVRDQIVRLPIDSLEQDLDELYFVSCFFVGDTNFVINKKCKKVIIADSSTELDLIRFCNNSGISNVEFLSSNRFSQTEIVVSGEFEGISFSSRINTDSALVKELNIQAIISDYGLIRIEQGAKTDFLYIDSVKVASSIKFMGVSKLLSILNTHAPDDITLIPNYKTRIRVMSVRIKQLAFTGDYESVVISGGNIVSSLYFKVESEVGRCLDLDLNESEVENELQFNGFSDSKLNKCEISNIKFNNIKRLTFSKSQTSCFSLINCDLSKTHVVFKHCKIDDFNAEGVVWPSEVHSSHFNQKIDTISDISKQQSVYRQLKSICSKNKDVDGFFLFRQRELEFIAMLSLIRVKNILHYFFLYVWFFVKFKRGAPPADVSHLRGANKFSSLLTELTSYFILKSSDILSSHNTSLIRPLLFLVLGTPFFLYLFGLSSSIQDLVQLSAHVVNPTHRHDVSISGVVVSISPIQSLFFRIYSSILIYKLVISFRRYASS